MYKCVRVGELKGVNSSKYDSSVLNEKHRRGGEGEGKFCLSFPYRFKTEEERISSFTFKTLGSPCGQSWWGS